MYLKLALRVLTKVGDALIITSYFAYFGGDLAITPLDFAYCTFIASL